MSNASEAPDSRRAERPEPQRSRLKRTLQAGASLGVVVGIFFGILPQVADFSRVWAAIVDMTWLEMTTLALAATWNLATYAFVMTAALPRLSLMQAFVVGQSSTAIATTLPAGSALGVGVTYAMYSSFGRSGPEIALAAVLTGLWNNFVKLGLPVVALLFLVVQGKAGVALITAAAVGSAVLAGAIVLFTLALRSPDIARRIGTTMATLVSFIRAIAHKPPVAWADSAVRFRAETIDLLRNRWPALTLASIVSHLSLYFVLLLALRHMGITDAEVSWSEALGVFALVRLVTALPVTPGGLGLVELGLTAGLVVAGGHESGVVAAVLVYRFLTLIVQVPLGAVSYLVWRSRSAWRHPSRSTTL